MTENANQIEEEPWFEDWQKLFNSLKVNFPEPDAEAEDIEEFKINFMDRWLKLMKQKLYDPSIQVLNSQDVGGDDFNAV